MSHAASPFLPSNSPNHPSTTMDPRGLPSPVPKIPLSLWSQTPPCPYAPLVPLFCSFSPSTSSFPPPMVLVDNTSIYQPRYTLTTLVACFGSTRLPNPTSLPNHLLSTVVHTLPRPRSAKSQACVMGTKLDRNYTASLPLPLL